MTNVVVSIDRDYHSRCVKVNNCANLVSKVTVTSSRFYRFFCLIIVTEYLASRGELGALTLSLQQWGQEPRQ